MDLPGSVVVCSYRLGGSDGVAIEAAKWCRALASLGVAVSTVAGAGDADVVLPGLAADADEPPDPAELATAFARADLVVVENLCSLPLNPAAAHAVARALAGRPAVLHHHDLASQRSTLAHLGPPPDDPAWWHVGVNRRTTTELLAHGYRAVTMYNTFDPAPDPGDRAATRARLGLGGEELLVLQPTRAIARKRVPAGIAFAEALGATFWLTGRVEDGYDEQLAVELAAAAVPIVRGTGATRPGREIDDAYAAADVVVLPSAWEGFGNPALEAATHRRPLAIADYPVARELRRFGFRWFGLDEHRVVTRWLAAPDPGLLDVNAALARRHFSTRISPVGWPA